MCAAAGTRVMGERGAAYSLSVVGDIDLVVNVEDVVPRRQLLGRGPEGIGWTQREGSCHGESGLAEHDGRTRGDDRYPGGQSYGARQVLPGQSGRGGRRQSLLRDACMGRRVFPAARESWPFWRESRPHARNARKQADMGGPGRDIGLRGDGAKAGTQSLRGVVMMRTDGPYIIVI